MDSTMLTYFPTPYPNEWWYSVLCRYHVRSGRQSLLATKNELGIPYAVNCVKLFPGNECYIPLQQIPDGIFNLDIILFKNTLLPYFLGLV